MAKQRNKLPVELIWVLVDLGLPQVNALINTAGNRHKGKVPEAELSVTSNIAGTQALIKIAEEETGFRKALSGAAKNAILRVFTEADHAEALELVRTPEWEPPEAPMEPPTPQPDLAILLLDTGAVAVVGEELDPDPKTPKPPKGP